ncbi:GNAT family N-acetyltransferase [Streptomyces xanthophaeus]|uniref:GNAT family N-acetyltransferase n=1 Tax=Streptomyces xanthophaeus TaxID=67385 RepID=UPI00386F3DE0|nr:GNAT family N-acetyltransferase [Streptomyces xanthophaeus]WST64742.1 GNAT family N-acetyltransferase [Streptomyces xanthophaeus]
MRSDVRLQALDQPLLQQLLRAAVEDADPEEVMPPVTGPAGWTSERKAAFLRFHRSRALAARPVETTFAVVVGARVVGAARLCPVKDADRAVEAGVWIGRSHRGAGVGGAVLGHLLDRARADGSAKLFISTTPDNEPVLRLIARLGADLVHDGGTVTARVDLEAPRSAE